LVSFKFCLSLIQESKLKKFQENTDIGSLQYESLQEQRKLIDNRVSALQEELKQLNKHAAQKAVLESMQELKKRTENTISEL